MPNLQPPPRHNPPSVWDHIKRHLFEVAIAAAAVVFGIGAIIGVFAPSFDMSPALAEVEPITAWLVGTFLCIGGLITVTAIVGKIKYFIDVLKLYQIGMALQGLGWGGWAYAIIAGGATTYAGLTLATFCSFACGVTYFVTIDWQEVKSAVREFLRRRK